MKLKKTFNRSLTASLLLFVAAAGLTSAAEVNFSKVFQGTGTTGLETNHVNITQETAGSNFKFQTQNYSDQNFNAAGSSVEGFMTYTRPDGSTRTVTGMTGVLSRSSAEGSTPIAYYFVTPEGAAYLMVVPGHENDASFIGEGEVETNADGLRDSLNALLAEQVLARQGTN